MADTPLGYIVITDTHILNALQLKAMVQLQYFSRQNHSNKIGVASD
jgi:hypothetical protein